MLHTQKDFQDCLMKILQPVKKYYTKGCTGIKCGHTGVLYGEEVALMEGFSRVLWGLAPFWGGQGEDKEFEEIYRKGIAGGTDPESDDYWGEITNMNQRIVETAAMGLSLIFAADKVWEPLDEKVKRNWYNWLKKVNEVEAPNNNWQFFSVIVNLGFKSVGLPYDEEHVKTVLEKVDSFYTGNGWYTDGKTTQIDYYVAFAMHFYGLIYAKLAEKDDPEHSRIFKERAMRFAQDFIYWFDEDGAALAFGRSTTYRFAQSCFWCACVFADIEPFPMGVMKGIIARNLEWWMEKPIFDNDGILSIGYAYPNLCVSEEYNSFGSPYWGLKTFLILALDENHPFYQAEALPLPPLNKVHPIPEAKMTLQRINGYVTAITAGQWAAWNPLYVAEKFSKFAYTSRYAYSVPRSYYRMESASTDSMLTFYKEDMCFVRKRCMEDRVEADGTVYSKWSPYAGVVVETRITPTDTGHIRNHTVTCEEESVAYDCGFTVPRDMAHAEEAKYGSITGTDKGAAVLINCKPNASLMFPETMMKCVKYVFLKGTTTVETVVVYPTV